MKELCILAVLGIREWPNLAQNLVTHRHWWKNTSRAMTLPLYNQPPYTTKIVPEKAQKWPKMARFWPKWRYNGRAMARETFFYQCLWVTKFCAKFGRSRIPRTASMHNSVIVLRCMWKEPAPLDKIVTASPKTPNVSENIAHVSQIFSCNDYD